MAKQQHRWTYQLQGAFSSDPVGPITESQLVGLTKEGTIKANTLVASPTRTKNQWVTAAKFPPLSKLLDEATEAKRAAVVGAKQTAIEAKQLAVVAQTEDDVIVAEVQQSSSQKDKLIERLSQFLMTGEQVEFVCMQTIKMLLKRDAIVSTNMRFIIAKPKLLGRFEFVDCMWIDLFDAHVKENMLGSTFEISSNEGKYTIENLSKKDARRIYQIAQDREQAVRWQRRNLAMEEKAAGAMQVNINQPTSPMPVAPALPIQPAADDPMVKLAKLKQMLDAGLIEQTEFDATKARVLESM